MATQYSNTPLVTNGLVYALDFGNQKSYVSGSLTTKNLIYSQISGTIYNGITSGSLLNGIFNFLNSTTPGLKIDINDPFRAIDYGAIYTVATTLKVSSGNNNQTIFSRGDWYSSAPYVTNRFALTYENGKLIHGLNYGPTNDLGFGRGYNFNTDSLVHLTFRYSSGSWDYFVNGIPQTASLGSTYSNPSAGSLTTFSGRGSLDQNSFTGSLGNFLIYNRALSSDEIYSNYLISARRYGLPAVRKLYTLDENAYLFLQSAGITDPTITSSINTFVLGLKSASLWDKMIAIYPFVGTGSVGVNLTGSHRWNLKEPSLVTYPLVFTGSWNSSVSGSTPSGSNTAINTLVTPSQYYPNYSNTNAHISILSYDTPVSSSILAGTGMTKEVAVSTLAGDYGTPAAAYSVRKVRTAYSGALMDVRRSIDNVTSSIGYVSNGDLDTGSLSTFVNAVGEYSPGSYSGLAAAYSLRRVSASYSGNAIDVRRSYDDVTGSVGFNTNGTLDTASLAAFVSRGNNIMLQSENFSSYPMYVGSLTSSATTAPDSTITATKLNGVAGNTSNWLSWLAPNTSGIQNGTYTYSIFAKKAEKRYLHMLPFTGSYSGVTAWFDLDSGSLGIVGSQLTASIQSVGNGWYRCSVIYTGLVSYFDLGGSFVNGDRGGSGLSTDGIYIWGSQLNSGSITLPYVKTVGTAKTNESGSFDTVSTGWVAQWYDQSGNARHATQTIASSQPLIVSSGSLVTEGTKPAVKFYTNLGMDTGFTGLVTKSLFIAANTEAGLNINDAGRRLFSSFTGGGGVGSELLIDGQGTGSFRYADGGATLTVLQTASYQLTTTIRNTTLNLAFNGGSISSGGSPDSNPNTLNYRIGEDAGLSSIETAKSIQEVLIYNNDQSANRTFIENNINTYYNVYTSSNAGYVARWYDQSGNNRHATQTTSSRQPLIVESGSVTTNSTRPGFKWNVSQSLTNVGSFTFNNVAWVAQATDSSGFGTIINTYRGFGASGEPLGDAYSLRANGSTYSYTGNQDDLTYIDGLMYYNGNLYTGNSILNRHLGFLKVGSGTYSSANGIQIGIHYASSRAWKGYINEVVLYSNDQLTNRGPIEYNINNYYNIYPQTSSFSTSSFAIYATTSSISASINNDLQSGIASSGPLGFITVSRTGSNSLTLARNGVTSSFAVPASGALSTNLYLGAINNNGLALGSSPYNISFASVGVGLTGPETKTLNTLVSDLQLNLGRLPSTYTLTTFPNAIAAFSVRKLSKTYTGSAFEVRRSSDNATLSIGFNTYGNLDTATLLSFVGTSTTSNGFITQWYDQSGNNNHLSQSTAASQPLIVNNGSIVTAQTFQTRLGSGPNGANNNTLPAIYFNGKTLGINRTLYSTNQISYYVVFNLGLSENLSSDGYSVMSTNTETGQSGWSWYTTGGGPSGYINMFQQAGSSRREGFPSSMPKGGSVLYSGYHTGSSYTVYVNNVSKGTDTSQQYGSGSFLTVGGGNNFGFAGSIQEIIFYATGSTANNSNIQDSINTYYKVY